MRRRDVALCFLGWLPLAACNSAREPIVRVAEPRSVDLAGLEAAVKQNLGRGTLINVWATW